MHTFKGSQGTVFNYNSDMSGDIIISRYSLEGYLNIPSFDILEFVAEFMRNQQISKLKGMDVHELLDL